MLSDLACARLEEHALEIIVDGFELESIPGEVAVAAPGGGLRISPWCSDYEVLSAWIESDAFLAAVEAL